LSGAHQTVHEPAFGAGLRPDQVKITGFPVRPWLVKGDPDRASLRRSLDWQSDLLMVLAIGSKPVGKPHDSLRALNYSCLPV
jgi:hypothetical protein